MTKRSSFVIPPVLADVAVIVDIVVRSPRNIDAKLARAPIWAGLSAGSRMTVTLR